MSLQVDVLCIGLAAYDISVFIPGFPAENSKWETDKMVESGGGPAANAAYLLSSWGARCMFAGLIGDDRYGSAIVSEFESVGVDVSLLEIRPHHPTPVATILVNTKNGSRTIVNRKDATAHFGLDKKALAGFIPRILLFDGHQLEASVDALHAFPDAVSVLDAGSLRKGTEVLAGEVDYLVCSENFALQSTGLPNLDTDENRRKCLEGLIKGSKGTVIVTMGERGLIYKADDDLRHLDAYPAHALDTTGAGDIFHGAFVWGLLQQMSLPDTLKLASMAAALSVEIEGGRASIPPLSAVVQDLGRVSS